MRIAELYEPRRFRIHRCACAGPGPGEVQVRVRSVGICGSDLHYFADGSIGDVIIHYPSCSDTSRQAKSGRQAPESPDCPRAIAQFWSLRSTAITASFAAADITTAART